MPDSSVRHIAQGPPRGGAPWRRPVEAPRGGAPTGFLKLLSVLEGGKDSLVLIYMKRAWAKITSRPPYNYLAEMLKAINIDKNSVIGYTVWSIIDNWEWTLGYTVKLGLYQVDFSDFNRGRTAKNSASTMSSIIKDWSIPEEYFTEGD
uniref:Uncharacterized protein n=1 Tax=Timema douglasi TaxID=61478 RepID=A0A7R8Z732_TIMDO|nr:unnamed protein product [Timema douglasi]